MSLSTAKSSHSMPAPRQKKSKRPRTPRKNPVVEALLQQALKTIGTVVDLAHNEHSNSIKNCGEAFRHEVHVARYISFGKRGADRVELSVTQATPHSTPTVHVVERYSLTKATTHYALGDLPCAFAHFQRVIAQIAPQALLP